MENDLGRILKECADVSDRDNYLQKTFGLSDSAMKQLQRKRSKRHATLADKLIDIGTFVSAAMQESDLQISYPLSSYFTCMSLAALVFDSWENPRSLSTRVSEAIVGEFKEDKKGLETFLGLSIPAIHLYRQEIDVYAGNLEDAKMLWTGIEVSEDDWMYSVQLPMKLDEKLAFVLGIIWADGCYNVNDKEIQLSAGEEDRLLYAAIVKPMLDDLFCKSFRIDDNREGEKEPRKTMRIHVQSRAICSFLMKEFGFPDKKEGYTIPNFESIEYYKQLLPEEKAAIKKHFFAGIISAMGAYYYNTERNSHCLVLSDYDVAFVSSINQLAKELRLTPRYYEFTQRKNGKKYGRINFNGPHCRQLYQEGYIRNPSLHAYASLIGFL